MSTTTASSSDTRIHALESEVSLLRRILGMKRDTTAALKEYALDDKDKLIHQKLMAVSPDNHVWVAVNALLDCHILMAHSIACDYTATNEVMRSGVSRESSLEDFRNSLLEFWANANKPVKSV